MVAAGVLFPGGRPSHAALRAASISSRSGAPNAQLVGSCPGTARSSVSRSAGVEDDKVLDVLASEGDDIVDIAGGRDVRGLAAFSAEAADGLQSDGGVRRIGRAQDALVADVRAISAGDEADGGAGGRSRSYLQGLRDARGMQVATGGDAVLLAVIAAARRGATAGVGELSRVGGGLVRTDGPVARARLARTAGVPRAPLRRLALRPPPLLGGPFVGRRSWRAGAARPRCVAGAASLGADGGVAVVAVLGVAVLAAGDAAGRGRGRRGSVGLGVVVAVKAVGVSGVVMVAGIDAAVGVGPVGVGEAGAITVAAFVVVVLPFGVAILGVRRGRTHRARARSLAVQMLRVRVAVVIAVVAVAVVVVQWLGAGAIVAIVVVVVVVLAGVAAGVPAGAVVDLAALAVVMTTEVVVRMPEVMVIAVVTIMMIVVVVAGSVMM